MTDLLSEVEYGRILGSFTAVAEDFGDTVAPDAIPLTGRVTFVPSKSNISYINSEGETASLYVAPVNAVISQGRIVGKDGKDGVVLLASNSNNVSASVLWNARISIDPIHSGDEAPEVHDFLIEVRRGEVASLIDVIKENSRVHNIALFHDAIAEAAAKFWERVEAGEFRGNQGPPGPAGVGIGVAGPAGADGKKGADGAPGVGGNILPDGDLEVSGFLVSGDYQESYDSVSGSKSVTLTNATSRKILLNPEKSYVGYAYVKAEYDVDVSLSIRVFGDQGDIDRVIDYSYSIPGGFWKKVTYLLDTKVGDQSMEIIVKSDGRVVKVDNFWLSDNSAVRGLQTELVETQERIEAALEKLDMDIDQVDAERAKLTENLNDLSVILEDTEIDLGNVNGQLDDLRDALANAAVGDNYYRDQNLSKPSGFTEDPSVTHSVDGGFGGGGSLTVSPGTSVRGAYDTLTVDSDSRTEVSRGTQYKVSARILPSENLPEGGGYIAIRPVTTAGSTSSGDRLDPIYIMAPETPGGTWSEISEVVDIPEGTVEIMVGVFLDSTYEGSAVFSDIGVRKAIDGTIIAPGSVGSGQIATDSIGTSHLIALAITADKIGANAVVAGKIDALAVNTRELAAEAVNADKLAAESVIAGKIAADSISARELIARSITAEKIETETITANEIKARTITSAEIATGTITSNEIKSRTIVADDIVSGTITSDELDVSNITANSAIIDGLWVNGISAKAISTARLSVGPGNIFPDPFFQDASKWSGPSTSIVADGSNPLDTFLRIVTTASQVGSYYGGESGRLVSVAPGTTYRIKVDVRVSSGGSSSIGVYFRGNTLSGAEAIQSTGFTSLVADNEWHTYESDITIPSDRRSTFTIGIYTRGTYYAGETVDVRNVQVVPKVSSTLIEDGAVTTQTMAADSINGDRIKAGTITANKITSGSFEGNHFSGGTFEGSAFVGGYYATSSRPGTYGGVMIDPTNGLRTWSSAGKLTVQIRPDNGQIMLSDYLKAVNDSGRGVMLIPTTSTGGGGLWFSHSGYGGGSDAAIYRSGYEPDGVEPLNIRGANGGHVAIYGGLEVNSGGILALSGTSNFSNIVHTNPPTITGTSANTVIASNPAGRFYRLGSSRRYKRNIVEWNPEPSRVLALQPRQWQDRIDNDPGMIRETWAVGFIAEEVHDLGLKQLVVYEGDGRGGWEPQSLNYDRFAAAQQVVLRDHESRIKSLESTIESLMEEIKDLRSSM